MKYDAIRRRVTTICDKHALLRIDVTIAPGTGQGGYIARAMPTSYHPIVEQRWREVGAKHQGSVDLKQLEEASKDVMMSIGTATGSSIEGALKSLVVLLNQQAEQRCTT